MQYFSIFFAAVIVEGLVEWVKTIYQNHRFNWPTLISLALGIVLCLAAKIDLFAMVGVPLVWPYAGQIMTGLLLSRGSNYVHGLMDMVTVKKGQE